MTTHARRVLWLTIGIVALGLGALGVVLPLLPTTPFVLVAAFAFAQSSQRLHDWLLAHHVFGDLITNWRRHGAIGRSVKIVAVVTMVATFVLSVALTLPPWLLIVQGIVLSGCAWFVLSRPRPPGQ